MAAPAAEGRDRDSSGVHGVRLPLRGGREGLGVTLRQRRTLKWLKVKQPPLSRRRAPVGAEEVVDQTPAILSAIHLSGARHRRGTTPWSPQATTSSWRWGPCATGGPPLPEPRVVRVTRIAHARRGLDRGRRPGSRVPGPTMSPGAESAGRSPRRPRPQAHRVLCCACGYSVRTRRTCRHSCWLPAAGGPSRSPGSLQMA